MSVNQFNDSGFFITSPILDHASLSMLEHDLAELHIDGAGARDLLDFPWCIELAKLIHAHPSIYPLLPDDSVAVQCTYFEKSKEQNWLVPIHQDVSIPVREKIDHANLSG
jgi:hypothetical protein